MRCRIADLIVEVPEQGGMAPRCQDYLTDESLPADVVIDASHYQLNSSAPVSPEIVSYVCSGAQFYAQLLRFSGMLLHSSAVEYEGKAYLFSGPCGVGKSTHARQWQQSFGDAVRVFNDDKPALRCLDGVWYAYGTPWCGKDGININIKVPIAGICFLKQAEENSIRAMTAAEAVSHIYWQTMNAWRKRENMDCLLCQIDKLVRSVPVWELKNAPGPESAKLAFETMYTDNC